MGTGQEGLVGTGQEFVGHRTGESGGHSTGDSPGFGQPRHVKEMVSVQRQLKKLQCSLLFTLDPKGMSDTKDDLKINIAQNIEEN